MVPEIPHIGVFVEFLQTPPQAFLIGLVSRIEKLLTRGDRRDFLKSSAITGVLAYGALSSDNIVLMT